MRGLGKWADAASAAKRPRLKARRKSSPAGKSSLPSVGRVSGPGESTAVRSVHMDLLSLGDEAEMSDNDPAAVRTVETLSVVGTDTPTSPQEKEARSAGGTPSY